MITHRLFLGVQMPRTLGLTPYPLVFKLADVTQNEGRSEWLGGCQNNGTLTDSLVLLPHLLKIDNRVPFVLRSSSTIGKVAHDHVN